MAEQIFWKKFESKVIDVDAPKGIVINYDNAFNKLDSDKDISRPGCFTKTLTENVNRSRWYMNHNMNLLLGVPFIEGTKQDDFGLLSYNRINLDKELSRDILSDYKLYKEYGRTLEHSIGYTVVQSKPYDIGEGKQGRELLELKLWEKSTLTSWGANEFTPLVDIKSMKDVNQMLEILEKMFSENMDYSDNRKRQAESLIKKLQSLSKEEPRESTLIDPEPIEAKIVLTSILKSLRNE